MHMPRPPAFSSPTTNGEKSSISPGRSPTVEGMSGGSSVLASAGCDAPLQGSISEPFSLQDKHDHTAAAEPQNSPNLPHCADGEGADDGGSSNQSSKVSSHEELTVTPGFDRISDILPTDASEPGHLPECITAQDTTVISQPGSRKSHLSALQHERGEKVNQDLEDVSASIQPVEKDHNHGDLTLQSASALLSVSCNGANQGSKSDTENAEVSGANKANQALHDDGSIMKNSHEALSAHDTVTPGFDTTSDVLPTDASERGKRKSVRPRKRYSNPVGPTGRRKNLPWTEKEEACLREAMAEFPIQNDARIPWIQILNYGSDVFHERRRPTDLKDKWRNMTKSSNPVGPTGRRKGLDWTEKKEAGLRNMEKQQAGDKEARKEAGKPRKRSSVHLQKRRPNPVGPTDLKDKWRSMNKKCAGY